MDLYPRKKLDVAFAVCSGAIHFCPDAGVDVRSDSRRLYYKFFASVWYTRAREEMSVTLMSETDNIASNDKCFIK